MAGIRLEFAQFGDFDSFDVFRSNEPMLLESLPAPVAQGLKTMFFVDANVPYGDYYYRVRVNRSSDSLVSEEIFIRFELSPPYDITVEFKNVEAPRFELNWDLVGFVDEQRYYCSETTIDIENLPTPKAVLANNVRNYVDTDIEVGKIYYVRLGAVKDGIEKISNQITALTDAYRATILADSPIAYYPLNELSGSVAEDIMSNPANGSIANCLLGQTALTEALGTCYYFNGSNGGIYLGSPSKFVISGPVSMEVWIKPTGSRGGNPFQINYNSGLRMQIGVPSISMIFAGAAKLNSSPLTLNGLYHIVFTCTASKLCTYVNGVLVASVTGGGWSGISSASNSSIGYLAPVNVELFQGYISNVALYDYELNDTQVLHHYNVGSAA